MMINYNYFLLLFLNKTYGVAALIIFPVLTQALCEVHAFGYPFSYISNFLFTNLQFQNYFGLGKY